MAGQTTVNGAGTRRDREPEGVIEGVSSLGNDIATLVTLQLRLATYDARDSLTRAAPGLISLGGALVLVPCCLVLGLFGLAGWLAARLEANPNVVMLAIAAAGFVLAGLAAVLGLRRVARSFTSFRRSQEELQRNIAWVRTVLAQSGR